MPAKSKKSVPAQQEALDPTAPVDPRRIVMRSVNDLRWHPSYAKHFRDMTRSQFAAVLEDVDKHGVRKPLEILRDGTLITGNHRLLAVQAINGGEKKPPIGKVPVVFRDDLGQQGDLAVELALVAANLDRRHMGTIHLARGYRFLLDNDPNGALIGGPGKLRDKVAERLRLSGPRLDRFMQLVMLPPEVQLAIATNRLPPTAAIEISEMPPQAMQEILAAIANGDSIRQLYLELRCFRFPRPNEPARRDEYVQRDVDVILRKVHHLLPVLDWAKKALLPEHRKQLAAVQQLIDGLRGAHKAKRKASGRRAAKTKPQRKDSPASSVRRSPARRH